MENEVFRSKYVVIQYDHETSIYTSTYMAETENMTDKEWRELLLQLVNVLEKYKPKYILDDNRERRYAYSPDMQAWTLELLVDNWNKKGLEKYVQILPKEIISHITAGQIDELANTKFSLHFENKFVTDYESAINWINE